MPTIEVENEDSDDRGFSDFVSAEGANTEAATDMREDIDNELREMIDGFGGEKGYQLRIYRTSPKKWEGVSIEGHVGTYEEWMDEDDLKSMFGGGTYQLKVYRPNSRGSWQYFRSISVKVAGKPRGEGIEEERHAPVDYGPPMEDNSLGSQAMDTMKQLVADARSNKGGMDMPAMMTMFGTMMEPIKAQMQASQTQLIEAQRVAAEKEARIMELITHKPDTSEKDSLLDKMFSTETSRSEHLRQMHESEMRQMRENAKEEIKRIEDRHREELRSRENQQEREISNITRANDQMITTLKMSYDSIINSLKSDIVRGERDLTKSDTELVALRAIKNKTVIETASEFAAMKEAIETISGGGSKDDDDDRKWYEKLAGQVLDNPESVGQVFSMVTGQGNPAAQQQQQAAQLTAATQQSEMTLDDIPLGQPFRAEDGQIYVRVPPDGSVVPYAQAMAMAEAAEAKKNGGVKKPDADDVKTAIRFMESAFTAGTTSSDFAQSARSMIPNDIIKYMETVGVDTFLNEVAVLEQGSPLRNQAGRTYMREVAKFLLEGVTG